MGQRSAVTAVMLVIEIIVLVLLVVLLCAGLAMIGSTGYQIGARAGYGAGLQMIGMATSMGVGAGALHFHRRHIEAGDRIEATVTRLAAGTETNDQHLRVLIAMEAERMQFDELAGRRNH